VAVLLCLGRVNPGPTGPSKESRGALVDGRRSLDSDGRFSVGSTSDMIIAKVESSSRSNVELNVSGKTVRGSSQAKLSSPRAMGGRPDEDKINGGPMEK
jgi:hypothetical protein